MYNAPQDNYFNSNACVVSDADMDGLGQAYTVEEVKERQSELSKMRALMFYHERKQHHMNKIKSKVRLQGPRWFP